MHFLKEQWLVNLNNNHRSYSSYILLFYGNERVFSFKADGARITEVTQLLAHLRKNSISFSLGV